MSPLLRSAALALFGASYVLGQAATSTINPLNEFIGVAGSAVSVINSARAKETAAAASASSASAAAASQSANSKPPAKSGNDHRNTIIAVVCGVVGAVLLLALLLGIFCVLRRHRRHRRRRDRKAADDDEKTFHRSQPTPPLNPGRNYTPLAQNRGVPTTSKPPVAPVVASAGPLNLNHDPARGNQNPFVPVPPSPRKPAFSNSAFINTTPRHSISDSSYTTHPHESYTTAQPYLAETSPLRATAPRSRSNSRPASGVGLAIAETAERPLTPVGVNRIGQPYDDTHVQVLQTDSPSSDLRRSWYGSDPVRRIHTPPLVPSRSPARRLPPTAAETSYESSTSNSSTTNTASDEDWRRSHGGTSGTSGWTSTPIRYSHGASGAVLPAPPVPWDHGQPRRHSGGDYPARSSMGHGATAGWTPGHDRQGSGTTINGQPRRLRFPDLTADRGHGNPSGGSGPYNNGADDHRYGPVGVGEAL